MLIKFFYISLVILINQANGALNIFKKSLDNLELKYGSFSESRRLEMLLESKKMFYFGYFTNL